METEEKFKDFCPKQKVEKVPPNNRFQTKESIEC